jgi:hypothetical protein
MTTLITAIPEDLDTPAKGVDFLATIDRQEDELEAQLKATKALRHTLETETLVELFDRFEQPEATSNSGAKAKRGMRVLGSLPKVGDKDSPEEARLHKAQREAAIVLAVSYGWSPFIQTEVTYKTDKGDREKALEVYKRLRLDNSATVDIDEGIHPMTLQAQVRKRLREGQELKLDVLNVTAQAAVTLTKKKSKE